MYTPPHAIPLDQVTQQQIRLGIQGYGKTGKTSAALTFPNPIVVNLDRGLGAHIGRKDVVELPFWSNEFCAKINSKHKNNSHIRDTLIQWLKSEGQKLEADQTLVWDGGTGTQNAYHAWYDNNRVYSVKSGKEDEFAQWKLKIEFFAELCEEFKRLRCHVVYICHEADKKDKATGEYTGKIRPLLTGQFQDQLVSHFSDWVRQLTADKPADFSKIQPETLYKWGFKTQAEFKEMCDKFPRNTIYFWQLESDDVFDGGVSSLVNFPRFIPATYESFLKYSKHKQTT